MISGDARPPRYQDWRHSNGSDNVLVKLSSNAKRKRDFDPNAFLSTIGTGREIIVFQRRRDLHTRRSYRRLFFIQKGKIQLIVVSDDGKEAILGILSEGDLLGEGGPAGQPLRRSSAVALTECVLLHIEKQEMMLAMSAEPTLSALFVQYVLKRKHAIPGPDLVDQLFNSSEKRLARVLLLMAQFGKEGVSEMTVPRLSQETLAEMVGTTRSRVSFFMNRFRKLGFINYVVGNNLHVHSSLPNVLLQDDNGTAAASDTVKGTSPADNTPEAPARPGGPPDKGRAKRPPLFLPKSM